jgi:hypothetical protein
MAETGVTCYPLRNEFSADINLLSLVLLIIHAFLPYDSAALSSVL